MICECEIEKLVTTYRCFSVFFLLSVVIQGIGVSQVVYGDSQEDIEQDVVTADEEDDKVWDGKDSDGLDPAEGLDAVVHNDVPILTGEDLFNSAAAVQWCAACRGM